MSHVYNSTTARKTSQSSLFVSAFVAAPVEESPTIYSVLRQDEERKEQKVEKDRQLNVTKPANNVPASNNAVGSKKNPIIGKKATEKKRDKVPSLEEALSEVCNILNSSHLHLL